MEREGHLIGRQSELGAIDAKLAETEAGGSPILLLLGDPGIGKSALLAALRTEAERRGMPVLAARAAEHERDVPFALAVDALDDAVASLHPRRLESLGEHRLSELAAVLPSAAAHADAPQGAPGPAERFRYHRAVRALLELLAGDRPLVLILDDLHWADEASLELVLHLVRRPARRPHLIALALRPVDPAARLLDALRGAPAATTLHLTALDDPAAHALVADVADPAVRDRIAREAGGNPLYLRELARAAHDPAAGLPPSLVAAVRQEVDALPPASRALIEGAAVAGDPFDPELAAAGADLAPADAEAPLDRLVATALVQPAGGARRFRFRHPVVRRAIYDAAPPAWRLAAHERIADVLHHRGAPAPTRAFHVEQYARPGDGAAVALLAEAAAATTSTAPAAAAHWYEAALHLIAADDAETRAALLAARAQALAAAGRVEEAADAFAAVLALRPDDLDLIRACAEVEYVLGRHDTARGRLERALAASEATGDLHAALQLQIAISATFMTDAETTARAARSALETAVAPALRSAALGVLSLGEIWSLRPAEALRAIDEATEILASVTDDELAPMLDAAFCVASGQLLCERFTAAAATARRGLAVARAARQERVLLPLSLVAAMGLWNDLSLDPAARMLDEAEEAARLLGLRYPLVFILWHRAQVLDLQGDALGARAAADECRSLIDADDPHQLDRTGLCNLATLLEDEDPEACLATLVSAGGSELERLDPVWATFLMRSATHAALAAGRPDEADRWATLLETRAAALGLPAARRRALTARAETLLARGEPAAAADRALEAAEGTDRDALLARLVAGRAQAAAGDDDAATATLRAVHATAADVGAGKLRDAAARELRRLGVRVTAPARAVPAGADPTDALSPREREITDLVVEGRSNKQIAATLFLSEKTVERHLSQAFRKLGVRTRVELTAHLAKRP